MEYTRKRTRVKIIKIISQLPVFNINIISQLMTYDILYTYIVRGDCTGYDCAVPCISRRVR